MFLSFLSASLIFHKTPITTDENSYLFQANIFKAGKLKLDFPTNVPAEILWKRMIILDDKVGWVSRYPPAHSLCLIPGLLLSDARYSVYLYFF